MQCAQLNFFQESRFLKNMPSQVVTRFDIVRTDRLRYLSTFAGSIPEARVWVEAFKGYGESAIDLPNGTSRIKITYEKDKYGRFHVCTEDNRGLSIPRMARSLRNWIVPPESKDIDIVNSAPVVIQQLAEKHGIQAPYLDYFVKHYQEAMDNLSDVGFKDGKAVKNWMLFSSMPGADNLPPWCDFIRRETSVIVDRLRDVYTSLWDLAIARDSQKRDEFESQSSYKRRRTNESHGGRSDSNYVKNVNGLFLNYLYQKYEGEILCAMDEIGRDIGIWDTDVSWIHDGMVVYPKMEISDDLLVKLENGIEGKTKIRVKLALKSMEPVMECDVTKFPKEVCFRGDHKEAAAIVKISLNGEYIRDENAEYCKMGNVWSRSTDAVKLFLLGKVQDMNLHKLVFNSKTEEEEAKAFSSITSHAKQIMDSLRCMIKDPTRVDFGREVILDGESKLMFRNGYYQFLDDQHEGKYGRFIEGGHFHSFASVDFDFPLRIQADIDFVFREIIDPIFLNTETGLKELFLAAVARALAGRMDKVTYILHGPRNSGKSVLFQFLDKTFGPYCKTIPSGVFACSDGVGGGDSFRQNGFMVDAETARIIKMSELPPSTGRSKVKMDGSKIKAFQSMKEGVVARALHHMQRPYYSLGTGFFLMNDVPEFVPLDSMDRCQLFEIPNEFVTQREKQEDPYNAFKLLARPEIERFIVEKRCCDALVHILLEAYRPTMIIPLPSMIQLKEEAMADQGDDVYLACLEVTMNPDDKVVFGDIKKALEKFGVHDNAVAMGRTLKRIIENAFKLQDRDPPSIADIKKQDYRRRSPTFKKQFYHYVRIRSMTDNNNHFSRSNNQESDNGGAYAPGFIP